MNNNGIFEDAVSVTLFTPTDREKFLIYNGRREIAYWKSRYHTILLCAIILTVLLLFALKSQYQENQLAYQFSSAVALQEDELLTKYRLLPCNVGLEDLRIAWINDPCYDTILHYYNALGEVLLELEMNFNPVENTPFLDTLLV